MTIVQLFTSLGYNYKALLELTLDYHVFSHLKGKKKLGQSFGNQLHYTKKENHGLAEPPEAAQNGGFSVKVGIQS